MIKKLLVRDTITVAQLKVKVMEAFQVPEEKRNSFVLSRKDGGPLEPLEENALLRDVHGNRQNGSLFVLQRIHA